MAGNNLQIFSKIGVIGISSTITAANTATDGTGTCPTIFTADATNGGRVERVRFMAQGTNVATVARIFINNGSTAGTATNNVLYAEVALPATTASNSAAINAQVYELPYQYASQSPPDTTAFPLVLPAGYKLIFCIGTAVAGGWACAALGGSY
jgi:hypothetical protein